MYSCKNLDCRKAMFIYSCFDINTLRSGKLHIYKVGKYKFIFILFKHLPGKAYSTQLFSFPKGTTVHCTDSQADILIPEEAESTAHMRSYLPERTTSRYCTRKQSVVYILNLSLYRTTYCSYCSYRKNIVHLLIISSKMCLLRFQMNYCRTLCIWLY